MKRHAIAPGSAFFALAAVLVSVWMSNSGCGQDVCGQAAQKIANCPGAASMSTATVTVAAGVGGSSAEGTSGAAGGSGPTCVASTQCIANCELQSSVGCSALIDYQNNGLTSVNGVSAALRMCINGCGLVDMTTSGGGSDFSSSNGGAGGKGGGGGAGGAGGKGGAGGTGGVAGGGGTAGATSTSSSTGP